MNRLSVLMLTRYGRQGASSRMRSIQYVEALRDAAIDCTVSPFFDDEMLARRYRAGDHGVLALARAYRLRLLRLLGIHRFDLVWIEKEALPWLPAWLERLLLARRPYVLDYDDAVFHNYDLHRSRVVRMLHGKRLDRLMAGATLVVGGNGYLAGRAWAAGARWIEVLPTTVDLARYPAPDFARAAPDNVQRIVWIGSPSTTRYLRWIEGALQALARRHRFKLRLIGGEAFHIPGVEVEAMPWSEDTEVAAIGECDVGVMPLQDSPWERGKCGYKLIQYMACGLPVVASDVGVNVQIVSPGINGYLARSSQDWEAALERLLADRALRVRLGRAGRKAVEAIYCLQRTAPSLGRWLHAAAALRSTAGGRAA